MFWTSVGDFLAMGGYGVYVWGAYGVTTLAVLAEVMALRGRARRSGPLTRRADEAHRS